MNFWNEKFSVLLLRAFAFLLILFVVPASAEKPKEENPTKTQALIVEQRLSSVEEKLNHLGRSNFLTPKEHDLTRKLNKC